MGNVTVRTLTGTNQNIQKGVAGTLTHLLPATYVYTILFYLTRNSYTSHRKGGGHGPLGQHLTPLYLLYTY